MELPTKAKITALVCSGRSRPKVSQEMPRLSRQSASCEAMITPSSIPTTPQTMVAMRNLRTIASS